MRLKLGNTTYATPELRRRFAFYLSGIIEGGREEYPFKPYCPNAPDDTFWTLDSANDWKLAFNEDAYDTFRIFYRYNSAYPEKEVALFNWLKTKSQAFELIQA